MATTTDLKVTPMSEALGKRSGDTKWHDISRAVEIEGKAIFKQRKNRTSR